jgi:uncharacterized protein YbjT (DUF2867 family)
MKVIILGASGMVGQGVLRECLIDPGIQRVLCIGRSAAAGSNPKLQQIVLEDLNRIADLGSTLEGYDACFDSLGSSAAGLSEVRYTELTYDLTLTVAKALLACNPQMTFVYVSGAGTDSSERGRVMWARVKGRTENALLELPFKAAFMFRPAAIQPLHGVKSKTALYRHLYTLMGPFLPLLRRLSPRYVTTTEQVGRAMIRAARAGAPKSVLESADINAL